MFENLREPDPFTGAAGVAPRLLSGEQRLEAHLLHCAIASLREARECATGHADAATIYGRIDGLVAERQAQLQALLGEGDR